MQTPTRKTGVLATAHPYIIGLSFASMGVAPEIQESETGLYLDELDDLNLRVVEAAKPNAALLALMEASRRDAYGQLETDIIAGLQSLNGPQVGKYIGSIGGNGAYQGVVDVPSGTELALTLYPRHGKNTTLVIKRIGLLLASSATVSVHISTETAPFEVVALADTPSYYTFATPLRVQLGDYCDTSNPIRINYTAAGFLARNNSTSCGCTAMDNRLLEFFGNIIKQPANGILLDIEVGENEAQVIIDGYTTNAAVANTIGYALRFKAAELLVERIINTDAINRFTLMDQQFLWGKRNEFRKNYQDRINWLISPDGLRVAVTPANIDRVPHMGTILL